MASLPLFLSLWLHYLSFYRYGFIAFPPPNKLFLSLLAFSSRR
jgi:hypothetical protein